MRGLVFADRNKKEILRDPLSFIFCLGFPVALLAIFRVISYNTGGHWMTMEQLGPGVAIFGVFSLGGWSPRLPTRFLVSRGTPDPARCTPLSNTRLSLSLAGFPKTVLLA